MNIEKCLSARMRADGQLTGYVADRVYTEIPGNAVYPLVRVTRIGGGLRDLVLDEPVIQVDCYGGPKGTAFDLAADAIKFCRERFPGRHPEGIVYGVNRPDAINVAGFRYLPDTTFDPAKARYLFIVTFLTRDLEPA